MPPYDAIPTRSIAASQRPIAYAAIGGFFIASAMALSLVLGNSFRAPWWLIAVPIYMLGYVFIHIAKAEAKALQHSAYMQGRSHGDRARRQG